MCAYEHAHARTCVCVYVCKYKCMYLLQAGCCTMSLFKRSKTGLNWKFSFSKTGCLTKAKENSVMYHSSIGGGREWFMPFLLILARDKTQTADVKIWTRIAQSTSNDNERYAISICAHTYVRTFCVCACVNEHIYIYIYISNPTVGVGCDTRSIFRCV